MRRVDFDTPPFEYLHNLLSGQEILDSPFFYRQYCNLVGHLITIQ